MGRWLHLGVVALAACAVRAAAPAGWVGSAGGYEWPGLTAEEKVVVDPPAISLSVEGATMKELAAAMSKATGAMITAAPTAESVANQPRYTVQVENRPFWEVFREIAPVQTGRMEVLGLGEPGFRLQPGGGNFVVGTRDMSVGGFRVVPYQMSRQRMVVPSAVKVEDMKQQQLQLYYHIVIDPRIWVVRASLPRIETAVDEAGHAWSPTEEQRREEARNQGLEGTGNSAISAIPATCLFKTDDTLGKRLTIKGEVQFDVVMEQRAVEIADIRGDVPATSAGGYRFGFSSVDAGNGYTSMSVQVQFEAKPPNRGAAKMRIQDMGEGGAGVLWEGPVVEVRTMEFLARVKGPVKATLWEPVRTKVVQLPFELKNLETPP